MKITIDPTKPTPLAEQIHHAIAAQIHTGAIKEGERLPGARELARLLDVNMHTVLKAYQQLRDEEIIELKRGKGAVVKKTNQADLLQAANEYFNQAIKAGLSRGEAIDFLKRIAPGN